MEAMSRDLFKQSHLLREVWLVLTHKQRTRLEDTQSLSNPGSLTLGVKLSLCLNLQRFPITFRMKSKLLTLFLCLCDSPIKM